jgi:hypothetical protein
MDTMFRSFAQNLYDKACRGTTAFACIPQAMLSPLMDHRASAPRKNFISVAVTFVNHNPQTERMLESRTMSVL